VELSEWHRWWKERGRRCVRHFLMDEWDPIGVAGIPEAADEYDSYVGRVGLLLHEGAESNEISAYLRGVREGRMGFDPSTNWRERDHVVAARLVEWYHAETRTA
jgi:hypothetical protein